MLVKYNKQFLKELAKLPKHSTPIDQVGNIEKNDRL